MNSHLRKVNLKDHVTTLHICYRAIIELIFHTLWFNCASCVAEFSLHLFSTVSKTWCVLQPLFSSPVDSDILRCLGNGLLHRPFLRHTECDTVILVELTLFCLLRCYLKHTCTVPWNISFLPGKLSCNSGINSRVWGTAWSYSVHLPKVKIIAGSIKCEWLLYRKYTIMILTSLW